MWGLCGSGRLNDIFFHFDFSTDGHNRVRSMYMCVLQKYMCHFFFQTVGSAVSHTVVDPLGPTVDHGMVSIKLLFFL